MQSEDDSLWESFPQALETLEGVRRYINAFQAPLQELNNLKSDQVHALRACSVLAIPPPMERMPPSGGFPKDLLEFNLLGWADLIQDMAAGLRAVPPNLNLEVCLPTMVLLQLLEATTGVGFCHFCCRVSPQCKGLGAYQQAPTETWSQVVEQIPGYGVAASSGGPTTPSTTTAEMPGYVMPPPGLTLPDFSNWSLPPPEIPHPGDYLWLQKACPAFKGQNWWWAYGLQANGPWHCLCQCQVLPRWHHHSISHDQANLPPHISRWYSHQESQLGGELQLNPPLTELPLQPVKPPKTMEGSRPEDGVTEAGQPVALGVHEGQHQMFPQLPPRKPLCLNEAAVQRASTPTLHCWH